MAKKLVDGIVSPNILEQIELSTEYNLIEIVAPKAIWDKTIKSSGFRNNYGVNIIAIRKQIPFINDDGQSDMKERINMIPGPEDEINQNDTLVVIGSKESLTKLKEDK
ncbi:MAG: hypothetical protein LBL16_01270 [Endomicrobium sp.]|jgi:trk system potassium uptake protein TrkA|nr:hypothetical protein [Endomicrobium sp.]